MEIEKLQSAIEAILFAMGDSVELEKLASAIEHDEETTKKLIHNMMDKYEAQDRGIRIIELDNAYAPILRLIFIHHVMDQFFCRLFIMFDS